RLGIIHELVPLLLRLGLQDVQTHAYTLEYRAGTPEWRLFFEDMKRIMQTFSPFARKWGQAPEVMASGDAEDLIQQAICDMQHPDFVATWHLLTAWGTKP